MVTISKYTLRSCQLELITEFKIKFHLPWIIINYHLESVILETKTRLLYSKILVKQLPTDNYKVINQQKLWAVLFKVMNIQQPVYICCPPEPENQAMFSAYNQNAVHAQQAHVTEKSTMKLGRHTHKDTFGNPGPLMIYIVKCQSMGLWLNSSFNIFCVCNIYWNGCTLFALECSIRTVISDTAD